MPSRTISIGDSKASILNLGDLYFRLADVEGSPESEWRQKYGVLFEKRLPFPTQSVLISTTSALILVDAGNYSLFAAADPSYTLKGYVPPSPLATQLEDLGVRRHDVTHVVITHAHYDHYAGVTEKTGELYTPAFPSARYYLGRADWESPEMQKALSSRESAESISLGVLHSLGLLELVDAESSLTQEVCVLPCPGESPGHQIVRLNSTGQNLYCLGDLFHHAVEVENIKLMSSWCDSPANIKSREWLLTRALAEEAVLVAAHMPPGRLSDTPDGLRFIAI